MSLGWGTDSLWDERSLILDSLEDLNARTIY